MCLLAVFLSGCIASKGLEGDTAEYRKRLARVLRLELSEPSEAQMLTFPDTRLMRQDISAVTINLTQWYGLRSCRLGTLIAERNTTLGKTAPSSQRLIYEAKLIEALQDCLLGQPQQSAQTQQLRGWLRTKLDQYPAVWANLIQTSPEMRQAFTMGHDNLAIAPGAGADASVRALQLLGQQREYNTVTDRELEQQLKTLANERLPATIWRLQAQLTAELENLNNQLPQFFQQLACPGRKASEQVEILRNVFYLFFIQKIQPVASRLNHHSYQLKPVWQAWLSDDALHPEFRYYLKYHTEEAFTAYQQAMAQHIELWQQLFARCSLSPQAPALL
ncbi:DUF3080 family protein [Alteromonas aestuariivivens]|uniref:DUF3080 family protein n=1 Tax=Alteromonas aestuariivivens TaxID=1938339 RepID=UPI0015F27D34|nr:DUF3080 family protein [Alteromonas aestuariivivens]